jgi:hypothetical protein
MTWFIFIGDMIVMAFMIFVFVLVSLKASKKSMDDVSRIPLEDEDRG